MDAQFVSGKPVEVTYNTAVAAGTVVVVGNLPAVAHTKGPPFSGGPAVGSVSTFGGIYKMTADGAISPGTDVYWDNTAKKVTLTATSNKHFGKLVAGPDGDLGGAGTATNGDACYVLHVPALLESGAALTAPLTITDNSNHSLAVGANGTTNPALVVDDSTGSAATGVKVTAKAAASGVAVAAISSGTNEALTVDAKGSGVITIGGTSTGIISLGRGSVSTAIFSSTKTTVSTQNSTPTAAQLLGGYIDHNSTTGAGTATLDTAANIDTAIPGVATGDSFECTYVNRGNQTVTITTAAGLTLRGTAAIPTLKNAILTFVRTGTATWDVLITLSA